jgi:DNA-binding NarL/FixJ family response regulator
VGQPSPRRIRPRYPRANPLPGSTPTERCVAELATPGMSDHEIATTAFITRKIVEAKLSRNYRKLGIHSRIEFVHTMNNTGSKRARAS